MSRAERRVMSAVALVLGVCGVVLTLLVLRREMSGRDAGGAAPVRKLGDWERLTTGGHMLGDPSSPHTIVVFLDYQCPACREFDDALSQLMRSHPRQLRTIVRHFPLQSLHPFARKAAEAAACANDQGVFPALHHTLFAFQDSIGALSWGQFGARAGVRDTVELNRCIASGQHIREIEEHLREARFQGLRATPSVAMDGDLFEGIPPMSVLEARLGGYARLQ